MVHRLVLQSYSLIFACALNIYLVFPFLFARLSLLYECLYETLLSFSINVTGIGLCLTVIVPVCKKTQLTLEDHKKSCWSSFYHYISVILSINEMLIERSSLMIWLCSVSSGLNVRVSLTELLRVHFFPLAWWHSSLVSWMWGRSHSIYFWQLFLPTVRVLLKAIPKASGAPLFLCQLCGQANHHHRTPNCLFWTGGNLLLLQKMGSDLWGHLGKNGRCYLGDSLSQAKCKVG